MSPRVATVAGLAAAATVSTLLLLSPPPPKLLTLTWDTNYQLSNEVTVIICSTNLAVDKTGNRIYIDTTN